MHDCRDLLQLLGNPSISHVYRESNQVADALAKEGANMYNIDPVVALEVPPFCVRSRLKQTNMEHLLED